MGLYHVNHHKFHVLWESKAEHISRLLAQGAAPKLYLVKYLGQQQKEVSAPKPLRSCPRQRGQAKRSTPRLCITGTA